MVRSWAPSPIRKNSLQQHHPVWWLIIEKSGRRKRGTDQKGSVRIYGRKRASADLLPLTKVVPTQHSSISVSEPLEPPARGSPSGAVGRGASSSSESEPLLLQGKPIWHMHVTLHMSLILFVPQFKGLDTQLFGCW